MKPILILQLRPEDEASDDEYAAFLDKGGLSSEETRRLRLDREALPNLDLNDFGGVIVGGGPGCVSDAPQEKSGQEARIEGDVLSLMPAITGRDFPFLGCCYGIGILGHHLGAEVSKRAYGEGVGTADCSIAEEARGDPLLAGVPARFPAFVGHKEAVQALPEGCTQLVRSPTCPLQMIRYGQNVYATQFHPEADGEGFALRIEIYKDRGYFAPEEAEKLKATCRAQRVDAPPRILRNFVNAIRSGTLAPRV